MSIVNTLIDISKESQLNKAEKISLREIAKEVQKLIKENKSLKEELQWLKENE